MPDLGKIADDNRDKIEQAAEKGVDAAEQRTGRTAPDQVDDAVDRIDPEDGDGGSTDDGRAGGTGTAASTEPSGAVDPTDDAPGS